MKFEDHVENIRKKTEAAVINTLGRVGVSENSFDFHVSDNEEISIGDINGFVESVKNDRQWKEVYTDIVDDYTFTLFNRLVCMKVMENLDLYPEMITRSKQYAGLSFAHSMWLEQNPKYKGAALDGLSYYVLSQFGELEDECELFSTTDPLHMVPTSAETKNIIDAINEVDFDSDVDDDQWKKGNILSQIYEIYNNKKKAELKASGEKTEYDKVQFQSQIYTPEWVVRFLVDNSLGKLYLSMYPNSELKCRHKIIGLNQSNTCDKKPIDQIKVLDPCVGSGNFLLYAFDLLYEMYEDQIDNYGADFNIREVPATIISKNLYGIDLDERAVQLTKVGLLLKAKAKRRNVVIKDFNIVSTSFRLPAYMNVRDLFDAGSLGGDADALIGDVWEDLRQAYKFGSLLKIDEKFNEKLESWKKETSGQLNLFDWQKAGDVDAFGKKFFEQTKVAISKNVEGRSSHIVGDASADAITFLEIMTRKYDVVASNPPYTDSSAYSDTELGVYISNNYKKPFNCTTNLYACFIYRNIRFCLNGGYVAMIHPHTFMAIDTYKDVRKLILDNAHIDSLVDYGLDRVNLFGPGILLDAVWHVLHISKNDKARTVFLNITENQQEKYKKDSFNQAVDDEIKQKENVRVISVDQEEFTKIQGTPFIYNISSELREKFQSTSIEKAGIKVAQGLHTGNNNRFIRLWWEIFNDIDQSIENDTWFFYSKGGPFCKWSGNRWALVNWKNDGYEIKNYYDDKGKQKSRPQNELYYKKSGITYNSASTKGSTFRIQPEGDLFDSMGSCVFSNEYDLNYLLAFFNSRLSFYLVDLLNPTVGTQVGDIKRIPFYKPDKSVEEQIVKYSRDCVTLKKSIDSGYLLNGAAFSRLEVKTTVADAMKSYIAAELLSWCKILINEAIIDQYICQLYQLSQDDKDKMTKKMGECVANLPVYEKAKDEFKNVLTDINSEQNDYINSLGTVEYKEKELEELRDKITVNLYQKNNEVEDFCLTNHVNPITLWYMVNCENVLPEFKTRQLSFEWIVMALRDILDQKVDGILAISDTDTSLTDTLLTYADSKGMTMAQMFQFEEFLGNRIRPYCEQSLFSDLSDYTNVFMYLPKTPFIWHLSSGDEGGFEALVTIYKWNRDSLFKIKAIYVTKRREKLESRRAELIGTNSAQTQREREKIDKQLSELGEFVTKLDDLIAEGYDPQIDDGVGKNIAPLQKKHLLKKDILNDKQLKKYLEADW